MKELPPTYDFGSFHLDSSKRLLWRGGVPVPIAPKVLDTLLVLIAHRERVVTKDELLEEDWEGAAVEEGGLSRNISVLRKALGEKPDEHTYIVTVPGKGYRFVADVREAVRRPKERVPEFVTAGAAPYAKPPAPRWLVFGALAALATAALVYALRPTASVEAGPP